MISKVISKDLRFPLKNGAGSDAVHTGATYSYAVCELHTDLHTGTGFAFTLGSGNELVCRAIDLLSTELQGKEINELMSCFGQWHNKIANHPEYRWLGPHKGIIHLALAAITNACFDLWAKQRGLPLWALLLELTNEQVIDLLDFTYVEDFLSKDEARSILQDHWHSRPERNSIISNNYRGYDTSIGWFDYSDEKVKENVMKSMDQGFTCMKLKVGSKDHSRDLQRAFMIREVAGPEATIMLDCNQQWQVKESIEFMLKVKDMNPYWIEEPTHPDDILGHQALARVINPVKVACGEHVPNRIIFKNYLQAGAMDINQVDAVRVGGISEFLLISLMSKKAGVPVVPHVGDMGQLHQHLVLFNHIAMGHEALFLEHIPHLQEYFKHPVKIENGFYLTPHEPGSSCDFKKIYEIQS